MGKILGTPTLMKSMMPARTAMNLTLLMIVKFLRSMGLIL